MKAQAAMSQQPVHATRPPPAHTPASQDNGRAGVDEMTLFSLRDTLDAISVREANFSEFLAALKRFGGHPGK